MNPVLTSRVHAPAGIIRHTPPPELIPFTFDPNWVIYQDKALLVINKPSGLLSVPGRGPEKKLSLLTLLIDHFQNPEIRIVHRLDMDTSGLMVFAKTVNAHRNLSRQFQERQTQKCYEAVCTGRLTTLKGYCKLPIRCDWQHRPLQMVDFLYGKPCETQWQCIAQRHGKSLIQMRPITGRSHQLRLHMKMLGHPILGDNLYADETTLNKSERLLLHAKQLGFFHPDTEDWLVFEQQSGFRLEPD